MKTLFILFGLLCMACAVVAQLFLWNQMPARDPDWFIYIPLGILFFGGGLFLLLGFYGLAPRKTGQRDAGGTLRHKELIAAELERERRRPSYPPATLSTSSQTAPPTAQELNRR